MPTLAYKGSWKGSWVRVLIFHGETHLTSPLEKAQKNLVLFGRLLKGLNVWLHGSKQGVQY